MSKLIHSYRLSCKIHYIKSVSTLGAISENGIRGPHSSDKIKASDPTTIVVRRLHLLT